MGRPLSGARLAKVEFSLFCLFPRAFGLGFIVKRSLIGLLAAGGWRMAAAIALRVARHFLCKSDRHLQALAEEGVE